MGFFREPVVIVTVSFCFFPIGVTILSCKAVLDICMGVILEDNKYSSFITFNTFFSFSLFCFWFFIILFFY